MHDLEQKIGEWKKSLQKGPYCTHDDLEELESHLRDEIEAMQEKGLDADEAFLIAIHRIGHADSLKEEYEKVNDKFITWKSRVRIVLFIIAWFVFFFGILGSSFFSLFDGPSLLFVVMGAFGIVLINFKFDTGDFRIIMRTLWLLPMTVEERHRGIIFWRSVTRALLAAGSLSTFASLIFMIKNLSDPNVWGPSIAVSLLSIFYAVVLVAMFSLPGECAVRWSEVERMEQS